MHKKVFITYEVKLMPKFLETEIKGNKICLLYFGNELIKPFKR